MPKPAKILIGVLIGYAGLVVAFEAMLGFLQPEQGVVLTIVTTGDDGVANDRVLARINDEGQIFVSANHWPRAWYNEALGNPNVEVALEGGDGPRGAYTAVAISGAEDERLQEAHAHPFAFRFITGFPPRYFLRLDPKS